LPKVGEVDGKKVGWGDDGVVERGAGGRCSDEDLRGVVMGCVVAAEAVELSQCIECGGEGGIVECSIQTEWLRREVSNLANMGGEVMAADARYRYGRWEGVGVVEERFVVDDVMGCGVVPITRGFG
jgi:hypothetical protein